MVCSTSQALCPSPAAPETPSQAYCLFWCGGTWLTQLARPGWPCSLRDLRCLWSCLCTKA